VKVIKSQSPDAARNEPLRVLTRHLDALLEVQKFLITKKPGPVLDALAVVQNDLDTRFYDIVSKL